VVAVPAVEFSVLGPVAATDPHGPLDLRGPRHRAVLARLLVARGRAVPLRRLVDDLWDRPPEGAAGAVQTFVGALRKALEPDRPPRSPARLLVTVAGGYALRTPPGTVDADRFETAVEQAGALLRSGRPEQARRLLDEALLLWQGPAYAEYAEEAWARPEATRLQELRLLGLHRRAEATLAAGRAADAVPELESLVAAAPLREESWRLLVLALYRAGRQGDALAALRRARAVLAEHLGVDPGPALRQLEADVLAQAPALAVPPAPADAVAGRPPREVFVGRGPELAALAAAAAEAAAAGPRLVLLSGVAGAGKTALAGVLAERLRSAGWDVAWGASPEVPGAPAAWPWAQMSAQLGGGSPDDGGSTPADPLTARFLRHRAIATALAARAVDRPLLLVFDDLQWADEDTLALVATLAGDRALGGVCVVGTFRSTDVTALLGETLGRLARSGPARVYLGGLSEPEVGELAEALTGSAPDPGRRRLLHARSGGNPFFAGELVRLWESEGDAAPDAVPAGVRDVVRSRLTRLPERARTVLRAAAVQGTDVDLDVLVRLVGDEEAVLDGVEAALLAGFLAEDGSGRLRFAHALVQEALYDGIPRSRRCRWHADAAGILREVRPADVEALAHHLLRAEDQVPAADVVPVVCAAARSAERRSAPHRAADLWQAAADALERLPGVDDRLALEVRTGLIRALAVTGGLADARRLRAEAVTVAERLGDPRVTAAVLGASDVPAIWTTPDDEALSTRLTEVAERTLAALPADAPGERARLLVTIAMQRRADEGPRGGEAAWEAERIARALGDPALLAAALNGRFLQSFARAGLAPERARIGEELLALSAGDPALATTEVLGHLVLLQARSALADLAAADRHAAAADAVAERHGLPVVGVFTAWYAALRAALAGRRDEARVAYRAAATRLMGTGMSGLEPGLLPLALLTVDLPDLDVGADGGPYEPWVRPLAHLARGDVAGARAALRAAPDSPRDLLFELRTCLLATAAVRLGERERAERLYAQLLPAVDELAGAGSGLVSLGPVAGYLADLAALLGRADRAAAHRRRAAEITGLLRPRPADG
jgi:DNA-binding SARP family transcriptional activator